MITFSNIPESVQKTLYDRMNMLDKNKLTKIGKTVDQKQNYMFSRSTFMRMISLQPPALDPRPVILSGGEADHEGNLVNNLWGSKTSTRTSDPFADVHHTKVNPGRYWAQGDPQPYRPMPGVKDISVEYKGGGRTLAATRGAEINWVCWTWEDLDRLTAHFLHTGNTVFIDWGWSGVGDIDPIEVEAFEIVKLDSNGKLDFAEPYKTVRRGDHNVKVPLLTLLPDHIIKQNGNYDAMIGIVQDFEWSVRDDGGFDCVTTLISTGVSILQQSLQTAGDPRLASLPPIIIDTTTEKIAEGSSGEAQSFLRDVREGMGYAAPAIVVLGEKIVDLWGTNVSKTIQDIYYSTPYLRPEFMDVGRRTSEAENTAAMKSDQAKPTKVDGKTWWGASEVQKHFVGSFKGEAMVKKISPYITFDTYVKDLYLQMYNMIKNDKTVMKSGNIIRLAGHLKPGTVVNKAGNSTDNVTVQKHWFAADVVSTNKYLFDELYVTWGFFEDNVLSRFFSRLMDDGKGIMGEFRSYEEAIDPETKDLVNIPIRIRNHANMLSTDLTKFLLLKSGQAMEQWARNVWKSGWKKKVSGDKWTKNHGPGSFGTEEFVGSPVGFVGKDEHWVDDVNLKIFDAEISKETIKSQKKLGISNPKTHSTDWGVLRNVYFNVKHLSQLMSNASGIEDAITNVWSDFSNEYGGIYDFYLDYSDDQNRIVVKDRGWTLNAVQDALANKSHPANPDAAGNETPGSYTGGLFVFPTWEKNSIVKSQNLSARLPDRMKLVAMYGASNLPDDDPKNKDSFTSTDHDDQAGLAWGRLTSPAASDFELSGLSTEAYEKKVLASAMLGKIDYPWRNNRLFGEKEADINKELYIQKLPADGDDTQGTKIYDSVIQRIMEKEHAEYMQILLEIAADVTGDKDVVFDDVEKEIEDLKKKRLARKKLWEKNMRARGSGRLGIDSLLGMYQAKGEQSWNDITGVKYSGGPLGGEWSEAYPFKLSSAFKQFMMKDIRGKGGMIEKSDPLVPIEFELEIDGVGAIYPGNAFQSSYLPEKYRKIACFQVVGLNQKLDSSGWTSTIKGQIRVSIKSDWPAEDDGDGELVDLEIVPGPRPLPGPLPVTIEVTITEIEEDITEPDPEPTPEPTPEPKRDIDTITTIELAQQQILRLDDDEEARRFYLGEDRSDLIPRLPEYRGHQGDRLYGGEHPEGLREGDYKWGIEVNPAGDVRLTINEMISDPETARRIAFEAIFGTTDKDGNLANGLMDHFPNTASNSWETMYNNIISTMISDYGEGGSTIIIGLGGSLINTPPIPIFDYEILEYVPIDKPLYTPDIDYDPQGWSDRRLKKNIELVGKSPSGINIYEWEYKDVNFMNSLSDKVYGEGKYRGVMADDIPLDAVTELDNGYLAVNYSKIDVDFEKIKRYKNDHIRK